MTREDRNRLIAQYAAGADEVVDALKGFPEDKLVAHPIPGKWSAREIVHHLADSETASAPCFSSRRPRANVAMLTPRFPSVDPT